MRFSFCPMNEAFADDIVAHWHYDGIYAFYDMDADKDDLEIFMNRDYWTEFTRGVVDETGELVGWATFYTENDEFWLALGLRPDLTGRGLGESFVDACVGQAIAHCAIPQSRIKLAVAQFNERAIKVYRRAGFTETGRETRDTHLGRLPFIIMERPVAGAAGQGQA